MSLWERLNKDHLLSPNSFDITQHLVRPVDSRPQAFSFENGTNRAHGSAPGPAILPGLSSFSSAQSTPASSNPTSYLIPPSELDPQKFLQDFQNKYSRTSSHATTAPLPPPPGPPSDNMVPAPGTLQYPTLQRVPMPSKSVPSSRAASQPTAEHVQKTYLTIPLQQQQQHTTPSTTPHSGLSPSVQSAHIASPVRHDVSRTVSSSSASDRPLHIPSFPPTSVYKPTTNNPNNNTYTSSTSASPSPASSGGNHQHFQHHNHQHHQQQQHQQQQYQHQKQQHYQHSGTTGYPHSMASTAVVQTPIQTQNIHTAQAATTQHNANYLSSSSSSSSSAAAVPVYTQSHTTHNTTTNYQRHAAPSTSHVPHPPSHTMNTMDRSMEQGSFPSVGSYSTNLGQSLSSSTMLNNTMATTSVMTLRNQLSDKNLEILELRDTQLKKAAEMDRMQRKFEHVVQDKERRLAEAEDMLQQMKRDLEEKNKWIHKLQEDISAVSHPSSSSREKEEKYLRTQFEQERLLASKEAETQTLRAMIDQLQKENRKLSQVAAESANVKANANTSDSAAGSTTRSAEQEPVLKSENLRLQASVALYEQQLRKYKHDNEKKRQQYEQQTLDKDQEINKLTEENKAYINRIRQLEGELQKRDELMDKIRTEDRSSAMLKDNDKLRDQIKQLESVQAKLIDDAATLKEELSTERTKSATLLTRLNSDSMKQFRHELALIQNDVSALTRLIKSVLQGEELNMNLLLGESTSLNSSMVESPSRSGLNSSGRGVSATERVLSMSRNNLSSSSSSARRPGGSVMPMPSPKNPSSSGLTHTGRLSISTASSLVNPTSSSMAAGTLQSTTTDGIYKDFEDLGRLKQDVSSIRTLIADYYADKFGNECITQ